MPAETHLFPCLKDNYGVLLHDKATGATAAIDVPDAQPVEAALKQKGWRLTDVLVTHHHADHTQGIPALKQHYGCRVVAPRAEANRIPFVDETVSDGDMVTVGDLMARVIATPGHTAGHISYWLRGPKLAFVGDTLFSIGCGRVIEGDAQMMWNSLLKLRELPDDAKVYCGHEYTRSNIRFAMTIEKDNQALAQWSAEVDQLLAKGQPSIPMVMGIEKAANPFLRADLPAMAQAVGLPGAPAWKVFAEIRARKDRF
jgi:hydroxyacylglutathione hydrolase